MKQAIMEAFASGKNAIANAVNSGRARVAAIDTSEVMGKASDVRFATGALAKNAAGGALVGGALNATAFETGNAFTPDSNIAGAFGSGAVIGGLAGGLMGASRFNIYRQANRMRRIDSANDIGKTGVFNGLDPTQTMSRDVRNSAEYKEALRVREADALNARAKEAMDAARAKVNSANAARDNYLDLRQKRAANIGGDVLNNTRSNRNTLNPMPMKGPMGPLPG